MPGYTRKKRRWYDFLLPSRSKRRIRPYWQRTQKKSQSSLSHRLAEDIVRLLNHISVGFLGIFTLIHIFAMFGFTPLVPLILLTGLCLSLGTAAVYHDRPFSKLAQLSTQIWRQPGKRLRKITSTTLGIVAALLKGLIAGVGFFIVSQHILHLAVPFLWPCVILLGISVALVQQTKLIEQARALCGVTKEKFLDTFYGKSLRQQCLLALRMPFILFHAIGQCAPGVLAITLLLAPILPLPAVIAIGVLCSSSLSLTAGRFYGKDFLDKRFSALKTAFKENVSGKYVKMLLSAVNGTLSSAAKGGLAFVGIVGSGMIFMTLATPPGWLLALGLVIGVSTTLVQAAKYFPKTYQALKGGSGEPAKRRGGTTGRVAKGLGAQPGVEARRVASATAISHPYGSPLARAHDHAPPGSTTTGKPHRQPLPSP